MRKLLGSKVVKRAIALAIAVTLVIGSPLTSMAVEQNPDDDGYHGFWGDVDDVGADNYDGNEQSEIDSDITDSVEAAQEAAELAEDAADSAEDALEEALKAQEAAEEAVNDIQEAVNQASVSANQAQGTAANAWDDVAALERQANAIQAGRDGYEQDVEDTMTISANQIDAYVTDAQEASISANEASISANSAAEKAKAATTLAEATAAQEEVRIAAEKAKQAAQQADQAYQEANALLEQAKAIYEQYILEDAQYNIVEDATIEGLKNTVSSNSISSNEVAFNQAKADYQAALLAAGDAAAAASSAAESANAASDLAAQYAEDAIENADDAINYYVDPAQAELDKTNQNIIAKENEIVGLAEQKAIAQTNYDNIVAGVTATATSTYNQTRTDKKSKMDTAKNKYDSQGWVTRKAQKIGYYGEYKTWKQAEDAYDDYNTSAKKQQVIREALESRSEYKALVAANKALNIATDILIVYQSDKSAQEKVVADTEAVRDSYLEGIKDANEEAQKQAIVDALKLEIGSSVEGINQTEYDAALSEYANDAWLAFIDGGDTNAIRGYLNNKYKASKWGKVFDELAITQWFTNPDKLIEQVEAAYHTTLKLQEEELATVNAYIAKTDAAGAADSAEIAAQAAQAAADAAKATTELKQAKKKLAKANKALKNAQKSLAAAKAAADSVQLTYVDFSAALATLELAKGAVALAEAAKFAAEEDANAAEDAKEIADAKVAELSKVVTPANKNTPTNVTTSLAVTNVSENLVTLIEQPVAQAAAPATTPARTTRAIANTTVIEEEETPQAAAPAVEEEETEEETVIEEDTTVIEDEAAPLVAEMETKGMSWLWLLLLIPVIAASYIGYRYYAKRKVVK